jgi:energy-converting hydrogenase Eha subunit A
MSSENQGLEAFVKEALLHSTREEVKKVLLEVGWSPEQATSAINAFADVNFPIPVPKPRPLLSAREAFLYLVLFSTLYLSAYHLGSLFFDFIDKVFPDPASSVNRLRYMDSMRWSVSSLLIAFPIFLFVSSYIGKQLLKNPIKRLSPIRRWLTYLTLFIAAGILIGDLTTLVYNVLGGELTKRFILKVGTVAIIAGTIFGYYLWDLRREEIE